MKAQLFKFKITAYDKSTGEVVISERYAVNAAQAAIDFFNYCLWADVCNSATTEIEVVPIEEG